MNFARIAAAVLLIGSLGMGGWVPCARAAPPEPSGPHPRLWLDAKTNQALPRLAKVEGSAVQRAVRQCARVGANKAAEAKNLYMGLDWAAHTSNCAIAYRATGDVKHARTAMHFFEALLDDWEMVGDDKGGDEAARHNSGYAIRAYGVHAAIAYDWLHDAPGMTPELLAKARKRFQAWTDWYYREGGGYRYKDPGTNYHAGYLFAVTVIAIAQASEAGGPGTRLWRHVHDQVWGREMKAAAQPGGLLDGGDWGEGWQYGPLAVSAYALASRAMIEQGVSLPDWQRWADNLLLRHIHALMPGEQGIFVGGDTQSENPSIVPHAWTLASVIAGPSSERSAQWARAEMERMGLATDDKTFLIFEVLAEARGVKAVPYPRERMPTSFLARGVGAFYVRSSWSPAASWMAVQCVKKIEVDHLPANAGNFVLTRGSDEVIVDPSPYGTLSSLTSNAPSVESAHLPPDYKPSQGYWSEKTGYAWARQTASAIAVARCDYADQFKFQDRPSDVPFANRDIVMVPSSNGNAAVVVVDRAKTGGAARALFLRFRTMAKLAMSGSMAKGTEGGSALLITPVFQSAGKGEIKATSKGDCFGSDTTRGACTGARFPVTDYRIKIPGPDALAIHVIDVAAQKDSVKAPTMTAGKDHRVISFERGKRRGVVVVANAGLDKLTYSAGPGHHVVLDAPMGGDGRSTVTATAAAGGCSISVSKSSGAGMDARPLVFAVSDACAVTEDPTMTAPVPASVDGAPIPTSGAGGSGARPGPRHLTAEDGGMTSTSGAGPDGGGPSGRGPGGPCGCNSQSRSPSTSFAMLALAGLAVRRRR